MSTGNTGIENASGLCLAVFYLIPAKQVAALIPPPLRIIEVMPGFTVGGIYAARHRKDRNEAMSEFGILPAYVRHDDRNGYFMHHHCVDNQGSAHNGAAADSGDFVWEVSDRRLGFTLFSGGRQLIGVRLRPLLRNLPFSANLPFVCLKGGNVAFMRNIFASNIALSLSTVSIPRESPLKGFPFRVKLISTFWEASNIVLREQEYAKGRVIKTADEAFGGSFGSGACKR